MSKERKPIYVKINPADVKIKEEPLDEEEQELYRCKICIKTFYSSTAIVNHARMEHFAAYSSGDADSWMETVQPEELPKPKIKLEEQKMIKVKTEQLISSMVPANLTTLANKNVQYIIIKADAGSLLVPRKEKKRVPVEKKEKSAPPPKVVKKPEVITGPFECLHPSTLTAAGLCHQMFFSCCEYSLHHRDEHSRRRKSNRCQVCEKLLGSLSKPDAAFSCPVCGEGFDDGSSLADHSLVHVREKPYKCTICEKRFTAQGGLQQHLRYHTGVRPYKCSLCDKAFTQKSGVDQHMRTHTKEKPYRCIVCPKRFCQSVHLKQHMRTHTNVTPFTCPVCRKKFKQSSHLNYHLKGHDHKKKSNSSSSADVMKVFYKPDASCEVMCASQDGDGVYTLEVQELSQEELENQEVIGQLETVGEEVTQEETEEQEIEEVEEVEEYEELSEGQMEELEEETAVEYEEQDELEGEEIESEDVMEEYILGDSVEDD